MGQCRMWFGQAFKAGNNLARSNQGALIISYLYANSVVEDDVGIGMAL